MDYNRNSNGCVRMAFRYSVGLHSVFKDQTFITLLKRANNKN
jgi:hypothetical protein